MACSAEDLLRAAAVQPFDLIICDHLFNADYSKSKRLSVETHSRQAAGQCCLFGGTTSQGIAQVPPEYFDTERFTVEEAMDRFWGVEALTQLVGTQPPFKTPMLMLLSGHKIEVPPNLGVISSRKPLKQWN
jgi:hypothetical protein